MTGQPRVPWPTVLLWSLAATGLAAAAVLAGVLRSEQGLAGLLVPGDRGPSVALVEQDFPDADLIDDSVGHDGQQFYAIARTLPHLDDAEPHLDRPRYRLQRITLPAAAWLLHPAGDGTGLLVALFGVGVLGLLIGAVATGVLAVHHGGPAWLAAGFPLLPGALAALAMTVADALATALALAAIAAFVRGRLPLAVVLAVLAVLAKEWTVLMLLGVLAWDRSRSSLGLVVAPALVAGTWRLWLGSQVAAGPQEIREIDPMFGLLDSARRWLEGYSLPAALFVTGAFVVGALVLLRSGLRSPLSWAVFVQLGAIVCLSDDVLANQWNASRATLGVFACALPLLVGPRLRDSSPTRPRAAPASAR